MICHPQKSQRSCIMCNKVYDQSLSTEQRTLNFPSRTYGPMLYKLEEALKNNTLKNTIRDIITNSDEKDLDCLMYLVDRLYPEYREMLEKLFVLK